MRRQARRETAPEVELRRLLHASGLRFRIHVPVAGTKRTLDIAFPSRKIAVDVRGCFWHACAEHGTAPEANAAWWAAKLTRNVERDRETQAALELDGWTYLIVWEHEDRRLAAQRVAAAVGKAELRRKVSP